MQQNDPDRKPATAAFRSLLWLMLNPRISAIAGVAGLVTAVYDLFGGDASTKIVVLVLALAAFFLASLFFDRLFPTLHGIEMRIMTQTVNIILTQQVPSQLYERLSRAMAVKELALSLTYFRHYKRAHSNVKLALALGGLKFEVRHGATCKVSPKWEPTTRT